MIFKALDFLSVLEGYIQDVYILNAIRVGKKCSPCVFKMFRRPFMGSRLRLVLVLGCFGFAGLGGTGCR